MESGAAHLVPIQASPVFSSLPKSINNEVQGNRKTHSNAAWVKLASLCVQLLVGLASYPL